MIPPDGLSEYTVELETRPMVSLDPMDLDRLQDAAALEPKMSDPVFALNESKGSVLVVFQLWAATAALAAALGCWLYFNILVRAGVEKSSDAIEMIAVQKTSDREGTEDKLVVTLPVKEEAGST